MSRPGCADRGTLSATTPPLTSASPADALNGRRILLLSAYEAGSHRQWRETLQAMLPMVQWTVLTLPARHFAWRVRGNSLSWAFNHRHTLTDNYDLVLATSLTDLSALRGFVPQLALVPTLVYFHENQFAYPAHRDGGQFDQTNRLSAQLTSLYTALCADHLLFNSDWNRQSFLSGCQHLLQSLPDEVPPALPQHLNECSTVLPVPLPDTLFTQNLRETPTDSQALSIVWNHRHEYDKGPALLLAIVEQLIDRGCLFRLHLLGQRFRRSPAAFATLRTRLKQWYACNGIEGGTDEWRADRSGYLALLDESDLVLSTADHDFQGLSVLEACARGCLPVVPDALAYPEFIPSFGRYTVDPASVSQTAEAACSLIERYRAQLAESSTAAQLRAETVATVQPLSANNQLDAWATTLLAAMTRQNRLSAQ